MEVGLDEPRRMADDGRSSRRHGPLHPFNATWPHEFTVTVDNTKIDLLTQASDIEFAKWVFDRMKVRSRDTRKAIIHHLLSHTQYAVVEPIEMESPTAA